MSERKKNNKKEEKQKLLELFLPPLESVVVCTPLSPSLVACHFILFNEL